MLTSRKTPPQRIYYITAGLALVTFCGIMLQFLNMPYFWDEVAVYYNAALWEYGHSLSILPGSVPPEFSRGHPLLFAFIYGSGFRLFGPHLWVGHSISLFISIGVACTTFVIAARYFSFRAALFALLLLLAQPLFVAQSTMVLPEMLLTLWVLLTVKAIIEKKYFHYFVFAGLALLTKESAVILPVVAIVSSIANNLLQKKKPFIAWKEWLTWLSPLLVFATFIMIQKTQNGWFLYPMHTGFISFTPGIILHKFWVYLYFLFFSQGRLAMGIIFMTAVLQAFYYYFARNERFKVREVHVVLLFLILVMLAYSSLNFYIYRYVLFLLPVLCIIAGAALDSLRIRPWMSLAVLAVTLLPCIGKMSTPLKYDLDSNMNYRHFVAIQKEATHYFEENHLTGTAIFPGFPFRASLLDARAGYLSGPAFTHLVDDPDKADYIYLFAWYNINDLLPKHHTVILLKSFEENEEEIRIYKVLPAPTSLPR